MVVEGSLNKETHGSDQLNEMELLMLMVGRLPDETDVSTSQGSTSEFVWKSKVVIFLVIN
jgi:hypothetical protein